LWEGTLAWEIFFRSASNPDENGVVLYGVVMYGVVIASGWKGVMWTASVPSAVKESASIYNRRMRSCESTAC
jgi:hypothetical protein